MRKLDAKETGYDPCGRGERISDADAGYQPACRFLVDDPGRRRHEYGSAAATEGVPAVGPSVFSGESAGVLQHPAGVFCRQRQYGHAHSAGPYLERSLKSLAASGTDHFRSQEDDQQQIDHDHRSRKRMQQVAGLFRPMRALFF